MLIPKRMRFPRYRHEPGKILVEERVHRLIEAVEPGGAVLFTIEFVEGLDHLAYLVEAIDEGGRLFVGVSHRLGDVLESSKGHVRLQPKGSTFLDGYLLWGPPQSPV